MHILLNAVRSKLSKSDREICPQHGDARRVCCNEGALHEARNKTSALCAVVSSNIEMAHSKSIHQLRKQSYMAAPCVRGAPSNVDDDGMYWINC